MTVQLTYRRGKSHAAHSCPRCWFCRALGRPWCGAQARRNRCAGDIEILVIDRNPYHNIRVRNYEVDTSEAVIPLGELLDPVGVDHRLAEVQGIDPVKQQVSVATNGGSEVMPTIGWCWRSAASSCAPRYPAWRPMASTLTRMRPPCDRGAPRRTRQAGGCGRPCDGGHRRRRLHRPRSGNRDAGQARKSRPLRQPAHHSR